MDASAPPAMPWPTPPVASTLRGTGHPAHIVRFTAAAIDALAHDEAEGVLAALGGPVCRCQLLQSGWKSVHDDPALLAHLVECETVPSDWGEDPLPPLLQPTTDGGHADRLRRRAEFAAIVSGTSSEFRLALARHIAERVVERWSELTTTAERSDVEFAVRAVLASCRIPTSAAPRPWVRIRVTDPHTESRVGVLRGGPLAIDVPVTWLVDVAAAGNVHEWWRDAWAA